VPYKQELRNKKYCVTLKRKIYAKDYYGRKEFQWNEYKFLSYFLLAEKQLIWLVVTKMVSQIWP
jgi:hypothetical protein